VEQLVDQLSLSSSCVVVAPNYIPDPWPASNIPVLATGAFPAGVTPADGVNTCYQWIGTLSQNETPLVQSIQQYLQSKFPKLTHTGLVGMCFGAKVVFNAANDAQRASDGSLSAVAGCHAAFLSAADVSTLTIPMCLLNSKDDQYDALQPFLSAPPHFFKNFPTMHHGWMGSRGTGDDADTNFENEHVAEKYREGLQDLSNFFTKAFAS
jgi:dienelactone hydrolase